MYESDKQCPKCGGPVEYDLACHTWPRTRDDGSEQWMSCMPCDSAIYWLCVAHSINCRPEDCFIDLHEGCGWDWTDGLNPRNPRSEENEAKNPHWDETIESPQKTSLRWWRNGS